MITNKKGVVVRNNSNNYTVEEIISGELFTCAIKGKFRLNNIRTTNPIAIGDIVEFETESDTGSAVISAIEPRHNYIIRRSTNLSKESHIIASNIDMVFLVVTLRNPTTSYEFIDRFLVTCEIYKIKVTILLNKSDLYEKDEIAAFCDNYALADYPVILTSTVTGEGLEQVQRLMQGHKTLFSGNSGVGKSSIIKILAPNFEIKTGDVSSSHHKGKHTTTFSQMFKLGEATYLIDTPGIKGFGLINVNNNELARYFPDLFHYVSQCQYYNCTHTHEPNCEVKKRVESGEVSYERYLSYLKILEDEKGKYR